ncbi:MAG: glycosyltransferase [Pyrinomonadaceae bacterium]
MTQFRSLKNKFSETLPLSVKLTLRRLLKACSRVPARLADFAGRFRSAKPVETPRVLQPLSVDDFSSITNALLDTLPAPEIDRHVTVSIIIPVFNKIHYTFQCLRSLFPEINVSDTEIIIANNASTDETSQVLGYFGNFIRVIDNPENKGFVDACNQGAAAARGEYLVFLNNDTIVLTGWLENLLQSVMKDPSVGAVGSMYLYPDGRIQEAGAIVWKTGEALHYGWGKSPEDRRFNFAREVDYCSAASLLVRQGLFDQLGGFDGRYSPAYYEDVDLCFGVRSLGYKVIYQPASRLIHYEGATAGTNTNASFKQYQSINRQKFFEKWRGLLEREHFENDPALAEEAANRKPGSRIIVFDDRVPMPDRDAGSARMSEILKSLARIGRPVFVPMKPLPEYERLLWQEGIETANVEDYVRLMKSRRFRVAILSRPEVAAALVKSIRRLDKKTKIVFDMVDAYFIRLRRESEITGDLALAKAARDHEKLELTLARESDQVWCAAPADKREVSRSVGEERIVVIPTIHSLKGRGKPWREREGLLFIGHLSHRPNSDAIHYFMREMLPLLKKSLPSVCFQIVGSNPSAEIQAYSSDSVKVLGYVPDIDPLFQSARVFVAPLRFGAGVNGKIGEALSYGIPVVTTSLAAEGLGLTHGKDAMIADDPQDFADCVLEVYRNEDLWQRLADCGYRHIENHFTPRVVGGKIAAGLRSLGVLDQE